MKLYFFYSSSNLKIAVQDEFSEVLNMTSGKISPTLPSGGNTFTIKSLSIITNEVDIELKSFERVVIAPTTIITKLVDEPVKRNENCSVSNWLFQKGYQMKIPGGNDKISS